MLHPLEINPEGKPKASVILLHGLGASGYDFVDIAKQLNLSKELGVRFVFPHAPIRKVQYMGNAKMRAWFDFGSLKWGSREDEDGIRTSEKIIANLINNELELGISSEKIILAGFSQGGAMALQCGLRYPKKLAGILVLSSWLPLRNTIANEKNISNQQIPILMLHGTNDDVIPLSWAVKSCNYLKENGYHSTIFTYSMRHNVCQEEIVTIGKWLNELLS